MSIYDIRPGDITGTTQSTQTIQNTQVPSDMEHRTRGMMKSVGSLLIIIGLIVGIIYIIKRKKN